MNELYGQTEANLLVSNCRAWFPARAGSIGEPVPGHVVAGVDPETGEELPPGEIGQLAVRREDDPVVFEEYLNRPEATAEVRVEAGTSRATSRNAAGTATSGSGPATTTSSSRAATASGRARSRRPSSSTRTSSRPAASACPTTRAARSSRRFCQTVDGVEDDDLREQVRTLVRENLAKHEDPRERAFVEGLTTTTTGKIRRTELRDRETE